MTLVIRDRDEEERLGWKEGGSKSEETKKGCKGLKDNIPRKENPWIKG